MALPAEPVTKKVLFEGLDCAEDKLEVYVAALAAAQQLGYEIRKAGDAHEHFEGRLKTDGRRVEIAVDVACSGLRTPGFEAFYGPYGIAVSASFRARKGGRQVAVEEANRFEERLRELAEQVTTVPPALNDRLTLGGLMIRPNPVSAGESFDVEFVVDVLDRTVDTDLTDVVLQIEIMRGGDVRYRAAPETVQCNNGSTTTVVKHLRASSEAGDYELGITALAGDLRDRRTVAFDIR
jgi:hypothetical protein